MKLHKRIIALAWLYKHTTQEQIRAHSHKDISDLRRGQPFISCMQGDSCKWQFSCCCVPWLKWGIMWVLLISIIHARALMTAAFLFSKLKPNFNLGMFLGFLPNRLLKIFLFYTLHKLHSFTKRVNKGKCSGKHNLHPLSKCSCDLQMCEGNQSWYECVIRIYHRSV